MNLEMILKYGFAVLLAVLGLVALLKQKTYLDSKTGQPTQIEIPLIGKMKTNYPALIFVFLAVVVLVIPPINPIISVKIRISPKPLAGNLGYLEGLVIDHENNELVTTSGKMLTRNFTKNDNIFVDISGIIALSEQFKDALLKQIDKEASYSGNGMFSSPGGI
jgi:hypothetical protein